MTFGIFRQSISLLSLGLFLQAQEARPPGAGEVKMPSWPTVSPTGETMVFEWRDDLWSVSTDGGRAARITAHPARDSYPVFSPDGTKIYFCSTRSGALQLFSMPAVGGPATQHSFHSEGGILESISPDGKSAILRGFRDAPGFRPNHLIRIDLTKDAPERYVFDEIGTESDWMPDGSSVLFCREGEQLYRKGYQGPRSSSIWSYDIEGETFTKLIKEETEARSPMPWPDSKGFYYLSERDGCFNLWSRTLDGSKDEQLTQFTDDGIMLPSLSADGSTIVFRREFDLWVFRPGKDTVPKRLDIWQAEDLADHSNEVRKITGTVDADFSKSGLEIVYKAEGELWAMDTVLREPNRITHTPGQEDDPVFSPDGKYIYYLYDDGLNANIHRMSRRDTDDYWWSGQSFKSEPVTEGGMPKRRFSLSPDGKRLAYVEGSGDLTIANADGSEPQVLFTCWDAPTFSWSPDGEWLVFAAQDQNFNRDIYIMPTDGTLEPFNVSRHPDFEGSPRWSPDGSKVAFLGRRLNSEMGLFYVDLRIEEAVRTPRRRKVHEAEEMMREDPLYQQENASESEDEPANELREERRLSAPNKPKKNTRRMRIDFDGLSERIVRLNTRGIEPERLIWSHDSEYLLFQSKNSSNDTLYRIKPEPKAKMDSYDDHRGLPIRSDEDGFYWIVSRAPAVLHKGKLKRYPVSSRMIRNRTEHQRMCFRLIWRTLRDRFYDEEMNGLDWTVIREKYEKAAADSPDSRTFDRIVTMMLGELNASHLTFESEVWPEPWENEGAEFQTTRHVGLRFKRGEGKEPLTVAHVIDDSPADNAYPPIQVGDTVVSVNGQRVNSSSPVHRFMSGRMDRSIEFVLLDGAGSEQIYELDPISYHKATLLAEAELIVKNREKVEALSDGKLGYIHIARMFWDEFEQFERQIYAAGHGKSGLVIDIRDNGGGFTTDHLLTVLCQPRHAVTIPRNGNPGYPQHRKVYASWHKPLVVLCNENSYSNSEIFAHAIKTLNRGKVVGVTTAGGVISAGKDRILDAGTLRVPFRGWFLPGSGEDMEMNGAVPDITIWPDPNDLVKGHDAQLQKAVEVLLEDVAPDVEKPFVPSYRNR